jgi:hypothetical protein
VENSVYGYKKQQDGSSPHLLVVGRSLQYFCTHFLDILSDNSAKSRHHINNSKGGVEYVANLKRTSGIL